MPTLTSRLWNFSTAVDTRTVTMDVHLPPSRHIGRYELLRAEDWLTDPPESPLKTLENQQVTELMTPGPGRSRMG